MLKKVYQVLLKSLEVEQFKKTESFYFQKQKKRETNFLGSGMPLLSSQRDVLIGIEMVIKQFLILIQFIYMYS